MLFQAFSVGRVGGHGGVRLQRCLQPLLEAVGLVEVLRQLSVGGFQLCHGFLLRLMCGFAALWVAPGLATREMLRTSRRVDVTRPPVLPPPATSRSGGRTRDAIRGLRALSARGTEPL